MLTNFEIEFTVTDWRRRFDVRHVFRTYVIETTRDPDTPPVSDISDVIRSGYDRAQDF